MLFFLGKFRQARTYEDAEMRLSLTTAILLTLFSLPVQAAEQSCAQTLRGRLSGILSIVTSMADYKAAMDAGYAACMVHYPQEFAPLREANDFMQVNMQRELDNAQAVLDHLINNAGDEEAATQSCKKDAHALVDGQYKKAYARRHKAMAEPDLVRRDQDSCLIVLDMVGKYRDYYSDFKQLRYVLYEAMKKQQKESGTVSRSSFKLFEKTRGALAGQSE